MWNRTLVITVIAFTILVVGCGSDNSSSTSGSTTTAAAAAATTTAGGSASTASAALCADRAALKSSIAGLTSVDIVKNGTAGVQSALTTIQTNLKALKADASQDLQPQVTAFQDAVTNLGTALTNAGSSGVTGVVTAAQAVATSGAALSTALDGLKCA